MMQVQLLPNAISELYAQVSNSGQLTLADRYGLMAAVLDESLDEEQRMAVNRIIYGIHKGKLVIVDEISSLSY
ncbi:hypothetical protein ACE1B6_03135 [Aerosakkonemataceae cyanobacterium BLCC-F154]|uniref:Uncharacterized protein n=1 Tax=Floridaenema fluviatile BLCC-F154 TaxID=3153640 RepID=A0ABV4Y697_9CYAN